MPITVERLQLSIPLPATVLGQPRVLTPDGLQLFASRNLSIVERFWSKVDRAGKGPHECWLWQGAFSRGGRSPDGRYGLAQQTIFYGAISEGSLDGGNAKRTWRANILTALLKPDTLTDVPPDDDEDLIPWLRRARRYYIEHLGLEAAHQCDQSQCCNPNHLEWETHSDNLSWQKYRQAQMEQDPGWLPRCMQAEAYGVVLKEPKEPR